MRQDKSKHCFSQAKKYIVGGVNSPVRAFNAVGGNPLFIDKAKGSRIYDVDQNEYIDYVMSWGPLILGHAHAEVINAVTKVAQLGTSYGAPTEMETKLAKKIVDAFFSIEKIRFVNSGTEAVMSAIRLARAYTNRTKIIKFEGCYHGHADSLLVKAGSGVATLGLANSLGVPQSFVSETIALPFNNIELIKDTMQKFGEEVACIIVEPIAGNMGVVLPQDGFLKILRSLTKEYGSLLIFDEVMTGFRVAYGGAQTLFNINPDITCLGKIIGGGLPVGAYGGRKEIMDMIAPIGPVYQAGTLSGNPIAMVAGLTTLELLADSNIYNELDKKTAVLENGFIENAKKYDISISVVRLGSMMTMFFSDKPVSNYKMASAVDTHAFARYFTAMLENGIYLPPSAFEAMFVSTAHSVEDIEKTLHAQALSFAKMQKNS